MSDVPERDGDDEREPRAMSFLAAAAWTIALVLSMGVLVQITEAVRPGAQNDAVNFVACKLLAYSVLLFVMVRAYAPTSPMRVALGFRSVSPMHVVLAAVAGAALAPGMAAVDDLIARRYPQSTEEVEAVAAIFATTTRVGRALLVVTLAVAIPVVQELFFRGILFGGLRRGRTLGTAMLATAIYFATAQLSPRFFFTTFAFGLVLAWLRAQSGSVVSAMAAHVAFETVGIVPFARTGDPAADFAYPRSWALGGVLVGILALVAARAIAARDERAAAANRDDG